MKLRLLSLVAVVVVSVPAWGAAVIPEAVPDLPVLGAPPLRGAGLITADLAPVAAAPKVVDGQIGDWTGSISRIGGTALYSRGEYVYQDYLMDDWGADDGQDAQRAAVTDPAAETEPRTSRIEALSQAAGEQFGADDFAPTSVAAPARYGNSEPLADGGLRNQADIEEVRVAADDSRLYVLVRTTGMTRNPGTAVLVLVDTEQGGSYPAPGGLTTQAEIAILTAGSDVLQATHRGQTFLGCAACPEIDVVTNATGFVNAVEIGIDRGFSPAIDGTPRIGVATGVSNETGTGLRAVKQGDAASDLINVAFRFDEPIRIWMDHDQALALRAGSIDRYLTPVSLAKLRAGATQSFQLSPGYYERVYESDSTINEESESGQYYQGPFQHYGLYLPTSYRPGTILPATWWTHYRGGHAHDAAAWVPGLIRQLGEQRQNIVITPGARGTSTWYVGRGHEDFLDVWDDSMASFPIDPDRVYLSGYSMGGFASWLLGMVYPDRWAGAFPTAGPPTQGLWLGVGAPMSPQQGADVAAELTFNIIENALNVPYVIYHGTDDELVPWPGVARMATRFQELGYRYRFYTFYGYEHYTAAIVDEWQEAARYFDQFKRDPNPPRVVYRRWPALERAVETVQTSTPLDYTFDGAYWVDGIQVRNVPIVSGKPDPAARGTVDARTLGRGEDVTLNVPEAGTGQQSTAYSMVGNRWLKNGRIAAQNEFQATLTNVAAATFDVARMALSTGRAVTATVTTDGPSELLLRGSWAGTPTVTGAASASYDGTILRIGLNTGTHSLTIVPEA